MKRLGLLLASVACAVAAPAHAAVFTEGFDAPFAGWEARWFGTQSNATNYYVSDNGADPSYQGAPDVSGLWLSDGDSYRDGGDYATINIRFTDAFATALTSLQLDVATALPNTALRFYDRAGAEIGAYTLADSPLSPYYTPTGYRSVGVTSVNGISGFSFLGFAQGNVIVDNLRAVTSDAAAVPEVSTWAMMILGLGMVGLAQRRRRVRLA